MNGSSPPVVTNAPVEFENEQVEAPECRKITDPFYRNLWNRLQINVGKPKDHTV